MGRGLAKDVRQIMVFSFQSRRRRVTTMCCLHQSELLEPGLVGVELLGSEGADKEFRVLELDTTAPELRFSRPYTVDTPIRDCLALCRFSYSGDLQRNQDKTCLNCPPTNRSPAPSGSLGALRSLCLSLTLTEHIHTPTHIPSLQPPPEHQIVKAVFLSQHHYIPSSHCLPI